MEEERGKPIESQNGNLQIKKRKFQLYKHPWLSLLAVVLTTIVSIILANNLVRWIGLSLNTPAGEFANAVTYHILTIFIFVPFVLRLPKGKRTFRRYLDDIGLARMQPFVQLVLLGLSCYVILALSQAAASFVYRISEGLPINGIFVRQVFDLSGDLPPGSPSLWISLWSNIFARYYSNNLDDSMDQILRLKMAAQWSVSRFQ